MYQKFVFFVFFFCLALGSNSAQNIQLLMSPSPSPYIADWQSKTETVTLIISNTGITELKVKVKTELYDGQGDLVANTDASKMPVLLVPPGVNQYTAEDIFPQYAVNYKGNMQRAISRTGRIPDDNYRFGVAITDPQTGAAVGSSGTVTKLFNITAYQAPILQNPLDNEVIFEKGITGMIFRWSPVMPSPKDIVTYRFQVFEIMEGQDNVTAFRSNQPIVEKDLKGVLQTTWPTEFALPEVGKKYVWTVTPLDGEDRMMVDGYGFAQPTMFSIQSAYCIKLDSLKVNCTATPGIYTFSYIITNQDASPAVFQNIAVNSSSPGGATITSYTPPLGTVIAASGGTLLVTGTITGSPFLNYICIRTKIQKQGDPGKNAEDYLCDSVKSCKCEDCDDKHFTLDAPTPSQIDFAKNILSYNQSVTIATNPPKTIKSITADLVYFEMMPENDMCIPCNKDAATYGHFTNGTNSQQWLGAQKSLTIDITTPQLTPCCSSLFRWCIRYKVEFTDCTTCNKLVCYEKKKEGCTTDDDHNIKNTK